MSPAKLLIITVNIDGIEAQALIDSGATNSLVKSGLVRNDVSPNCTNHNYILGLGNNKLRVKGQTDIKFSWIGTEFKISALIVDPNDIEVDIILGADFLKDSEVCVNMKCRRISFSEPDKSKTLVYFDESNKVTKVIRERVPVYSKSAVNLRVTDFVEIPVDIKKPAVIDNKQTEELIYYEGEGDRGKYLDG